MMSLFSKSAHAPPCSLSSIHLYLRSRPLLPSRLNSRASLLRAQVLGGPGDRVELSVQLISPTLPTLSALSATNPAIVSAVIGECLPIEIFSNYTERCICLPGFELVLGTADVFEAYSTSSLCRACPPGSFSGEPGSESCKPCLNNLLSTG